MGWNNYKWAWNLRGVTPSEQIVCLRLADEANGSGVIDKLSHHGLQRKIPGLSRRRLREVIRVLHQEKGLIRARLRRFGAGGQQISNGYQLNLRRFHPVDPVGAKLWESLLECYKGEFREPTKIHAEGSTAYYTQEWKVLSVFLESKHALRFFESNKTMIDGKVKTSTPTISRLEFILPGFDNL